MPREDGSTLWRWAIGGITGAVLMFVVYELNVNWNVATQYTSRADLKQHLDNDDKRFELFKEALQKQIDETVTKFRQHDGSIQEVTNTLSTINARLTLVEGRQNDVRTSLAELRAGQVALGLSIQELKNLYYQSLQNQRKSDRTTEWEEYRSKTPPLEAPHDPKVAYPPQVAILPNRNSVK